MKIRFVKKRDDAAALACVRADGTSTWQRQRGHFFVMHDLTHYAVETTLGLANGFFGLLAQGWNISDFGTPWPRGPIPQEAAKDAGLAEMVTGFLDMERATGVTLDIEDLNGWLAQAGLKLSEPLTDMTLTQIRTRFAKLRERWAIVPVGKALELRFPRPFRPSLHYSGEQ